MRRLNREIKEFRNRIRYDWEGNELVKYKDCKHASNLMPCITRSWNCVIVLTNMLNTKEKTNEGRGMV